MAMATIVTLAVTAVDSFHVLTFLQQVLRFGSVEPLHGNMLILRGSRGTAAIIGAVVVPGRISTAASSLSLSLSSSSITVAGLTLRRLATWSAAPSVANCISSVLGEGRYSVKSCTPVVTHDSSVEDTLIFSEGETLNQMSVSMRGSCVSETVWIDT